jgi:hypothetical protein
MNGTAEGVPHFRKVWNEILADIDVLVSNYKSKKEIA